MDHLIQPGLPEYWLLLAALLCGRGMDFLSTWVATPNLLLEANPLARKLGWRWGIPLNVVLCIGFALWPLPAIIIGTTSALVAAHNFQSAWLMRTMGEVPYRDWLFRRLAEAPRGLFVFCLVAQTENVRHEAWASPRSTLSVGRWAFGLRSGGKEPREARSTSP